MINFVTAIELLVLVLHSVESVRAHRDDLLNVVAVKDLYVALHHCCGQVFVAQTPGRFAAAHLLLAKDREVDTRALKILAVSMAIFLFS